MLATARWEVSDLVVEGDRATVTADFELGRGEQAMEGALRFTLRREGDAWRVTVLESGTR